MAKKTAFLIMLLVGIEAAGCGGSPQPLATLPADYFEHSPRPVIIDTDMAMDDWLAMLYLLRRPDVDVQAILVVGTGEAHCEPGIRNALEIAALAGQPEMPVACGRETPLAGDHEFPQAWRDGSDNLQGLTLPDNTFPPSHQSAPELLAAIVESSPEPVTLITLGPLTNVAEAFQADPTLAKKLETVVIMGGAVDAAGNVAGSAEGVDDSNTFAEWNIYVDPKAAAMVFQSGAKITLVPLDATNQVPATMEFYARLEANRATPVAEFAYEVLTGNLDFIRSGGYFFWDPLTSVIATDPSLATFEQRALTVVVDEGPQSGRTQPASNGNMIMVALSADKARFETIFLNVLNR